LKFKVDVFCLFFIGEQGIHEPVLSLLVGVDVEGLGLLYTGYSARRFIRHRFIMDENSINCDKVFEKKKNHIKMG
jgi:hypothetical protein